MNTTPPMPADDRDHLPAPRPLTPLRALAMVALLAGALWLGWKAWDVNITLSCWKDEWPNLPVCDEVLGRTPAEKVARLQARLAQNPGDSEARVALALWARAPDAPPGLDGEALLAQAAKAAPQDFSVLRLLSYDALDKENWPEAIDPLVRLALFHKDTASQRTLGLMISQAGSAPGLEQALLSAVRANGLWLDPVLRTMPKDKLPVASSVQLVSALMAQGQLTPALGQFVIRELKREGDWVDAHAVWRHLWRRKLPVVFNGDFEQAFVRDGFDWEVGDANDHRSGARVSLVPRAEHGQVLQVVFTGKAIRPPVLRQDMLLPPGRYRLSGTMMSKDLRSEQGLAWVVSCAADGRELGRSAALGVTGRTWQPWSTEITMPQDCAGLGARLTLQTFAPFEAKTGLRGEVWMDGITMALENETP